MSITWKEIWNRFSYFKNSNDRGEVPPSLTSTIQTPKPQDYDVNFRNQVSQMIGEDPGVAGVFGSSDYMSWIAGAEQSKETNVRLNREMEMNAWVDDGLAEYVSTALNADEKGETIHLNVKNEDLSNNNNIRDNLMKEFEHIKETVIGYDLVFGEWFREFVLMGECGVELLVPQDNVDLRTKGIHSVKLLRSEQYVAYHDSNGNLDGFIIKNPYDQGVRVLAQKNQIAYVDSGVYDYISGIGYGWAQQYIPSPDRVLRIPRSFLQGTRKPYKQLDALEDSIVIYRMCLVGDTRVQTPNKKYQYIKDINVGESVLTYDIEKNMFVPTKVTNKWMTGIKQTYKVYTKNSCVTGTESHPLFVYDQETDRKDFVAIKDLNPDKHLVVGKTGCDEGVDIEFPDVTNPACTLIDKSTWVNYDIPNKEQMIIDLSESTFIPVNRLRNFLYGQQYIPENEFYVLRDELDILQDAEVEFKSDAQYRNDLNLPQCIDEEFAQLFGFLIGDGSINRGRIVFAEGVYPEQNEYYASLMTRFFGSCTRYQSKNRKYSNYGSCNGLGSKLLEEMGFVNGSHNKRIPEWVFQSKPHIRKAFVMGLLDADGWNKPLATSNAWEISLCNKMLIEDLKELWSSLGLSSGQIRTRIRKSECREIDGQYRTMPETTSWELYLSEIPLPQLQPIVKIEKGEIEEVYDIEVDHKDHNFVANYLTVHNSRAPERLVFNVATGNLPKSKGEQYLQKLINKFRKKLTYNPDTGEVDQGQNVKNIMEDFWFIKDQSGKGTDVTTIGGGQNLGEIEDINYFLSKLWRSMKIPSSRMNGEGVFDQNPGSMSTEEIKFQKWIYFILKRFARLIKKIYVEHLKMKGIWQHYNLKEEDLEIVPVPPSYFTYMKNAEYLEAQFARFANFANNIDVETPIFARKTALKEGLGWTEEKIAQNQEWLDEEQQGDVEDEEGMEGGEGDMGGLGGDEPGGGDEGGIGELGL